MSNATEIEGTGEELEHILKAMPKRRFRILLLPEEATAQAEATAPFYETASAEEWIRLFTKWAQDHPADQPPLPDEALDRESIYEGRA